MAIRIGVDPGWYEEQRYRRERSLHNLLSAMRAADARRAQQGEATLGFLAQDPYGTSGPAGQAAFKRYGDDPVFRTGYGALQGQESLMDKLMGGAAEGREEYGSTRDEASRLSGLADVGGAMSMSAPGPGGLAGAFAGLGEALERQTAPAAAETSRRLIGMDPSGMRPSFESLSPREQSFLLSNSKSLGLLPERLIPDTFGYGDMSPTQGALHYYGQAGMVDPSEVVTAARAAAGTIPSPGKLAEGEASALRQREGEANRDDLSRGLVDYREQSAMRVKQFEDRLIRGREEFEAGLKGGGEGGDAGPKQTYSAYISALRDDIALNLPSATPPDPEEKLDTAKYNAELTKDKQFSNAAASKVAKIAGQLSKLPPDQQERARAAVSGASIGEIYQVYLERYKGDAEKARREALADLDRIIRQLATGAPPDAPE